MNCNIFINVVLMIILADVKHFHYKKIIYFSNFFCSTQKIHGQGLQLGKPKPLKNCLFPQCPFIPICADGSQPMNGRCEGAEIDDCFFIQCTPLPVCIGRHEPVFLENECCPRCRGPSNICKNVSCFRPRRFCESNENPLPSEACCPVCANLN